jgi:8-oxo-dGTP pyrophosphatase MutT (NUDIX family)
MKSLLRLLCGIGRLRWRITRPVTLGVRLLLVRDGSVLLVKHTYQPLWFLVGGGMQRNETVEQAARREASEEVGASLGELRLHGLYTNFFDYKSDHVVVFACTDFTLTDVRSGEIEQHAFFPSDCLPDNTAAGHRRRIVEFFSGATTPIVSTW